MIAPMPDTHCRYALSTSRPHRQTSDTATGVFTHDPLSALRWYLAHERGPAPSVTMHASNDNGATWQPLPPHQLMAEAEASLTARHHAPGVQDLQRLLAADAADWLDARIRFLPPHEPITPPSRPPALFAWQRGGQLWALTLGTVPHHQVLISLASRYGGGHCDGPDRLCQAARDTLDAVALAESPGGAAVSDLLHALNYLNRLTLGFDTGHLCRRAHTAQRCLLDYLAARLPETAGVTAPFDPTDPARRAVDIYVQQLARITNDPSAKPDLLADARSAVAHARVSRPTDSPRVTSDAATRRSRPLATVLPFRSNMQQPMPQRSHQPIDCSASERRAGDNADARH